MTGTPVAFLIFNRPDTTARVFEAIRRARPARLLVVADGPRSGRPDDARLCAEVRAVIDSVDWPCEVLKDFAERNLGCKKRVSTGLDWVFSQVEEAIILEDDCLPHPGFFPFCEQLLERYRDDERVMMIGGTNYLLDRLAIKESYFFSRYFPIWGWASWKRAWSRYDIAMKDWERFRSERQLNSFYSQRFMRSYVTNMFDAAHDNRIDTWDIQWFYSCLFNNGLCAVPRVNLISNIGLAGTHTSGDTSNNLFPLFDIEVDDLRHPQQVYPNFLYDNEFFAKKLKPGAKDLLKKVYAAMWKKYRTSVL
ncbi:MAG: glycosyltransferase family 2 protein [Deltaproteobacteria bacterium]|nr:glycosyltransferase family 2 protein [Deltaproteobacteria bacterium]